MLAPNSSYSISSMAALREVNSLTSPMTKTQAESVLASFVAKGWLLKSKCVDSFVCVTHESYLTSLTTQPLLSSRKGRFSLSPRALLELQPYLKSTYPEEVLDCTICFEVGILFKTPPPLKKIFLKRSDHTHGTLTCRSLRAVARVPGRIAESGCTTRATRRTAGPTANAPPAARTGGEWETRGSSPSARRRRLKTTGHVGREGVPQRKATTNGKATRMLPRQAVLLSLLKHRQRVATSSALRAQGNRCHYSAKLVPHLMTVFSQYPSCRNGCRRSRGASTNRETGEGPSWLNMADCCVC